MFKNEQGFTLIELILGIVILAVGLTGVLSYFTQGMRNSSYAQNTAVATTLAQDLMEEIRSKCWDQTATTVSPCGGTVTPSALGPDGGETRATYNDVDDFNGLSNTQPKDSQGSTMPNPYNNMTSNTFLRTVSVCYVPGGNLNDTSTCNTTTNYKRIAVTVSWRSVSGDQVQLVSVVTNH